MRLMGMRFRDFTWRENPVSLRVECLRDVGEAPVPYGLSQAEDLGLRRRRVTGEGCFAGEDCMERWRALQRAYAQPGPGLLQLPGVAPFWALMERLELKGAPGRDLVGYGFSFVECRGKAPAAGQVFSAQAGETLWDWANRAGLPVEKLVEANPHIRDIGKLEEGEKVRIP